MSQQFLDTEGNISGIFEHVMFHMLPSTQVSVIAPAILTALRLQTCQINSIVTPISYRAWAVKSCGLRGPVTQTVLRDISQYTKYAVCSRDLDFTWDDMAGLDSIV